MALAPPPGSSSLSPVHRLRAAGLTPPRHSRDHGDFWGGGGGGGRRSCQLGYYCPDLGGHLSGTPTQGKWDNLAALFPPLSYLSWKEDSVCVWRHVCVCVCACVCARTQFYKLRGSLLAWGSLHDFWPYGLCPCDFMTWVQSVSPWRVSVCGVLEEKLMAQREIRGRLVRNSTGENIKKMETGVSLVGQWLRICLAVQGTQARFLVRELRSHMPLSKEASTIEPTCSEACTPRVNGPQWKTMHDTRKLPRAATKTQGGQITFFKERWRQPVLVKGGRNRHCYHFKNWYIVDTQ